MQTYLIEINGKSYVCLLGTDNEAVKNRVKSWLVVDPVKIYIDDRKIGSPLQLVATLYPEK